MDKITESSQDYLKAIYTLSKRHGRAITTQIAAQLDVSHASVTSMIKKLAQVDPPLVTYRKRRGTTLTDAGTEAALTVLRRHRLLELYLFEKLGYTWDEVHEEADRLEHGVSPQMMDQIASVLGEPTINPHGQPIPSPDLVMPVIAERPLPTLTPGTQTTIQRVRDEDASFLRYLADNNLIPGREIIVQASEVDGTIQVLAHGQTNPVCLSPQMAEHIFVT
jgi:DtxR family Mn-dependent transcriptional regulator